MDLYGVAFGVWFGISCYRLFEIFQIDASNLKDGFDPTEEFDVSPLAYHFWTVVSAFGWPIFITYAYFIAGDEDEDG